VKNWKRQEKRKAAKKEGKRNKRSDMQTAELDRRDPVTATRSWPNFPLARGTEVDYQVAAPTASRTPNLHRATIAPQECGWKGGDRGGLAQWRQFGKRRNKEEIKKKKEKMKEK
jgi:hypothetical protein